MGRSVRRLLDYYTASCNSQVRISAAQNLKGSQMESCRPKPPLAARPLIGAVEAERVGTLFKSLAHPTRLRLLHALIRVDELSVGDLADETGMTVQAISNQLQRLAEVGVVGRRRDGLQALYRVIDPCVPVLLERGWCHIDEHDNELDPGRFSGSTVQVDQGV